MIVRPALSVLHLPTAENQGHSDKLGIFTILTLTTDSMGVQRVSLHFDNIVAYYK